MEPIALGELHLTPEQFGDYTVKEIDALFDGYVKRRERLEDLLIINCALPVYRSLLGDKAPSYQSLIKHRKEQSNSVGTIDAEEAEFWREIL